MIGGILKQYIKIKAYTDDNKFLGTFTLSIELYYSTPSIDDISNINQEIKLDSSIYNIPSNSSISLFNVPIVYEFDNKTPIQYLKNSENGVYIMLLEEFKYNLSFKESDYFKTNFKDTKVFDSLLKYSNQSLELFSDTYNGFLSFGSYVGKSFFDIKLNNNKTLFKIPFEVRSRKIDYAKEYAAMIGDLSKYSQNLIYDSASPLHQSVMIDEIRDKSGYEEFMLLEYLFKDENLPSTVEYLSRNLYSSLENTVEEVPTSFASNINPNDLIDVFSNSENLYESGDESSIWHERTKGYVPLRVKETRYVDNIDVPENRFYKNFLESIESLIIALLAKVNSDTYIEDRLNVYKEHISAYLSQRYFKDISVMEYVPLNSQLLQKKEGYRDILEYYLMFEFGFKLSWNEISQEFKGNEKKLFELYEYWSYFELLSVLDSISVDSIEFNDIFKEDDANEFNIVLKDDLVKHFPINLGGKTVCVDLMYQRTFNRSNLEYTSYSVKLIPDYSLIIHIDDKRYIVHFDAKYKLYVDSDRYKNEDIVKMHAYKDAIEDTIGSYVLYPGSTNDIYYENDDELESVGAFALTPGDDRENRKELKAFILGLLGKLLEG